MAKARWNGANHNMLLNGSRRITNGAIGDNKHILRILLQGAQPTIPRHVALGIRVSSRPIQRRSFSFELKSPELAFLLSFFTHLEGGYDSFCGGVYSGRCVSWRIWSPPCFILLFSHFGKVVVWLSRTYPVTFSASSYMSSNF